MCCTWCLCGTSAYSTGCIWFQRRRYNFSTNGFGQRHIHLNLLHPHTSMVYPALRTSGRLSTILFLASTSASWTFLATVVKQPLVSLLTWLQKATTARTDPRHIWMSENNTDIIKRNVMFRTLKRSVCQDLLLLLFPEICFRKKNLRKYMSGNMCQEIYFWKCSFNFKMKFFPIFGHLCIVSDRKLGIFSFWS